MLKEWIPECIPKHWTMHIEEEDPVDTCEVSTCVTEEQIKDLNIDVDQDDGQTFIIKLHLFVKYCHCIKI